MLEAQGIRRGDREEEMVRLAQQGKIETILGYKKSIDLRNLFSPPPPRPSRVFLIDGAPGMGKSTLALHICHQWAQGASWLARFDLVILVYLRDQAIQNASILADILPADTFESVASQLQATKGKNVLFIFDGWDEFPPNLMNNSLVSTILRQPLKISLHQSTVLITSRPVSSGNLLHIADRRVEILGFGRHQIREYIEKALDGNSTLVQKLVQHLEEHPVIEGYCYVPLHVAILVHVFLTMKGALPTTLHELFCNLVLCCIVRELDTHESESDKSEVYSLDDLPDDLKSKLNNLSILAYNGVMQGKVVFYLRDLQASHLPTNLPSLGLLQAVEGLTLIIKSLSYNFLHLSVQELLAAYYISQMVRSEQVKVFKKLFERSRFQAVLNFYSGFTKLDNPEIHAFISSFQTKKKSFEDLLPLLHCFFETQESSLCQLIDPRFIPSDPQELNSMHLAPSDLLVVRYFLTSLLSTSTAYPELQAIISSIEQRISDSDHDHDVIRVTHDLAKTSLGVAVTMEITNIGTQGYPGVGKTSVLDLAMGKEPAPTRTSTDCVDPPSRYLMIDSATEGVEWEIVTTSKMFELVCKATKKTIEDNPPDIAESDNSTAAISSSDKEHKLQANSIPSLPDLDNPTTIASHEFTSDTEHKQASNVPSLSAPSPDHVFPKLLKELSTSKSSGVIFNSHWMMVTDCGGQPPFLDAAALFLRNSCLQIFPIKLNEPLSKRPEFSYFYKGVCASFDEDCVPLTHKQIIETLAKSVASIQPPYTPSATKCPKGAKFTIVGTFEDEAHKCSETVAEKESILKQVLKPYKRFQVQLGKKVILPVNAVAIDTETKKERTESAKQLSALLHKSALDVSMKINMKLRWFGFLLSILTIAEKENKAVLALDECYKLGDSLGMDKLETRKAIQFFHDISLIMHFDTPKLRDSVIINTKPVLNKLSRIISVSFLDEQFLVDHYKIVLPSGAKELLQYHGRLSRDTLEKCVKFTEPITLQFFLDVLEHVKIAVATDKESEYFMPCALSYAPEASVSEPSPPWVIRLRVRQGVEDVYIPIPVGYLPAVVVFLLIKFASFFSTDLHQQQQRRQYRNRIKLRYKRGGFLHLIERHLQLEIYFSLCEQLPRDCTTIRNHVLESIRLTEEKLHIIQEGEGAITKVDSFLCSCGKGSAHHTCAYNPLSGILECMESEETGECCKLDPLHKLWLGVYTLHSL